MDEVGVGFGYKLQWLAVYGQGADAVAGALGLSRPTPASWRDAVDAAYHGHGDWLLTPPLDGWTLAASKDVPAPEDDRFVAWLAELSRRLGTVQYFGTHRVVDYHGWGRASDGVVQRAFAYLGERGEVLFQVGEPTADEQALGVAAAYRADEPWSEDDEASPWPDEETVLALAGRWSVDPRTLDGAPVPGGPYLASA
ncbi:hypothetical protein ACVCAH_12850 [Micromonospora sp. LZ34]